jgi:hypothetical protein
MARSLSKRKAETVIEAAPVRCSAAACSVR